MITLLDGGMGQELVARTGKATPLWAVQALIDAPEVVADVHRDYFAAGAEIATTNTYNLLPDRLEAYGDGTPLEPLLDTACRMACAARDAHGQGQVAGSLGPLGASYRIDLTPEPEVAAETYAALARLHAAYVDIHLLETVASVDQARGGLMGTSVTGKPVWLAITVDDADGTRLRSGEPVTAMLEVVQAHGAAALLVNCSTPEAVSQALAHLSGAACPVGAYANGFTHIADAFFEHGPTVDVLSTRQDLSPARYADFADGWVDLGATIIGGCCEVGPAHIKALADRLTTA